MSGTPATGLGGTQMRHALLASCALWLVLPSGALAGDITIPSGTTVTTTQTLTDVGDTGTIDSGGAIDVTDEDGLVLDNDDQTAVNNGDIFVERTGGLNRAGIGSNEDNATITNNGTITTTGDNAFGIAGDGDNMNVTNAGTISTSGEDSDGILSLGDDTEISNSGDIKTTGEDAYGIDAVGDDATVTNSGTIDTTGEGAHGLAALGTDVMVTNSGTITTTGDFAYGIDTDEDGADVTNTGTITTSGEDSDGYDSDGDDVTLRNSGVITASGKNADGIDNDGDRATITNSGTINVSGEDSNGIESDGDDVTIINSGTVRNTGAVSGLDDDNGHGIWAKDDNVTVTNSGKVFSSNGSSIYIDGSNATVTLNEGSVLQGVLTFTDPTTATLTYSAGRTAILTFSSIPDTLTSGDLEFSSNGNTVTYFNPDDFQLGTTALTFNALSRELADVTERQMDLSRLGETGFVATNGSPAQTVADRWAVWATPYGGVLNRSGSDGFDHSFGGLMGGAERGFGADLRAGVTGGFSVGQTDSDNDIHSADTYSIFAGGYLTRNWHATFAQVSLLGGYLNRDEEVSVLNNLVAGGIQDVSIGYDYVFVSPTVRLGRTFASAQGTFTPSVRARYSGLWQTGDATENSTGLTVSGRSLNVAELRGQTEYDFAPIIQDTGAFHFGVAAGVDGIFTLSDDVDGDLSGTALNLSIDNDDAVVRGFAAANAVWQSNGGAKFLAGIEGGYDSAETLSATVRLGGKVAF